VSGLPLLLASTSPYRRELLARLGLPFEAAAPPFEESAPPGLAPRDVALHNAVGKVRATAALHPDRLVIGSDQVADLDGLPLGKPGDEAGAVAQLTRMAGKRVTFHTGIAVVRGERVEARCEDFTVTLRRLTHEEIVAYVRREEPYGCAGSFKIEGLGVALMEGMEGRDYTALIGLPLIALTELLSRFGIRVLI